MTKTTIHSQDDAVQACDILHGLGVEVVVITSLYYEKDGNITLMGSSRKHDTLDRFVIQMPSLPHYYTGTGDLFGSLLLGWTLRHPDQLSLACEKAVAGIRSVILNTAAHQQCQEATGVNRHSELRIIQSRQDLESPQIELRAIPI